MKLISKLRAVLDRESRFKDENTGLLSLLRYILLIWTCYYAFDAIYLLVLGHLHCSLILCIGAFLFALYIWFSYKIRIRNCLALTIITVAIISGYLTTVFGWRSSFQYFIYVAFLILWYDPLTAIRLKVLFSIAMAACVCTISILTPFGYSVLDTSKAEYSVLIYSNMIIFFVCLSVVAFFFCTKYVETEHKLREYNRKLKLMSETDSLTKLMNRRFAQEEISRIEDECVVEKYSFCIAIGDIDFFKKVNDTYGHDAGDLVLSTLADMFREHMEGHGFVARWGGEEFLFVLTRMNGDEALVFLDELRRKVKNATLEHKDISFKVTMTYGVEEYSPRHGIESAIESADKKLYKGKQEGRDRVMF